MERLGKIRIFTDKYPLLGPVVWLLSIQNFVIGFIVAAAWPRPYNWANDLISDLGNSACGNYGSHYVCSPDHALMNISFITLGATMAIGSLLIYQEFRQNRASLVGFSLLTLAGLGTAIVGIFPENTIGWLHGFGAVLALGIGNAALVVLAASLSRVRRGWRIYTFLTGVITLAAFTLYLLGINFGLGKGTLERVASWPQTIWLILFGLYMSASHFRNEV